METKTDLGYQLMVPAKLQPSTFEFTWLHVNGCSSSPQVGEDTSAHASNEKAHDSVKEMMFEIKPAIQPE